MIPALVAMKVLGDMVESGKTGINALPNTLIAHGSTVTNTMRQVVVAIATAAPR